MKKLKRLALSLTLMSVLAAAAFAGETNAPPCAPGETQSPPCAAQSVNDDSAVPGETTLHRLCPRLMSPTSPKPCCGRCRCSNPASPALAFADQR